MKVNLKTAIQNRGEDFQIKVSRDFIKEYGIGWFIERCERGATGGVRGLIDKADYEKGQLNIGVVVFWAQAYANYVKKNLKKKSIFLGFDTRHHSALFGEAISRVLLANGIKILRDTNPNQPTPTAVITFLAEFYNLGGGIIITASHNPANQNGIKTSNFSGALETDESSEKILKEIKNLCKNKNGIIKIGGIKDNTKLVYINALEEYYRNYIIKIFPKEARVAVEKASKRGWKFIIDGICGVGGRTMEYFLNKIFLKNSNWRQQIRIINEKYDPDMRGIYFPDPTNPQVLVESGLIDKMKKEKAEIGGTGDADWDRFGLVVSLRENQIERAKRFGLFVSEVPGLKLVRFQPDQLFCLVSYFRIKELIEKKANLNNCYCLTTFGSSHLTEELGNFFGINVRYSSVGFKYLGNLIVGLEKAAVKNKEIILVNAQEESGGNQIGYLNGLDKEGNLGNKNKDTATLLFIIMWVSAKLFIENKNLIDLYFEMLDEIKVIHFYERMDVYLPKPDPKNEISEKIKLDEERKRARVADELEERPDLVARLLGDKLLKDEPEEFFSSNGSLFEKIDEKGRIIWRRIYKKRGEEPTFSQKGKWEYAKVRVRKYSMASGRSFLIYHIGEGPRIDVYDENQKIVCWIVFRPSGTEAGLLRIYVELLERNLEKPNPLFLVDFARPFFEHLELKELTPQLEKRLMEKYS